MPGNMWQLDCPNCRARFEVSTGVTDELWEAVQMVCIRCRQLMTIWRRHGDEALESPACSSCGGPLVPWEGRVGFEASPSPLTGPEFVEGPCPACGAELQAVEVGLWD
jgi:hypothetical protein